jgi:hypothetical protein
VPSKRSRKAVDYTNKKTVDEELGVDNVRVVMRETPTLFGCNHVFVLRCAAVSLIRRILSFRLRPTARFKSGPRVSAICLWTV